jgi:NADPH-dependent 7-cyano-7-deazaguanine reductase QueF
MGFFNSADKPYLEQTKPAYLHLKKLKLQEFSFKNEHNYHRDTMKQMLLLLTQMVFFQEIHVF